MSMIEIRDLTYTYPGAEEPTLKEWILRLKEEISLPS